MTNHVRRGIAVALACTFALTACGDDDDTSATDSAEETSSTTEATSTTESPSSSSTTAAEAESATDGETVGEVATAAGATFIPGYTQFAPGFEEAITGAGPVTALMPSDEGFIAFGQKHPDLVETMRQDFEMLDEVLLYHLVEGEALAAALGGQTEVMTLQGEPITIEMIDGAVVLNGGEATISQPDLTASNGVVHVLDGILLPPSISATAG